MIEENKHLKPSKEIIEFIISYESLHDGDLSTIELEPKLCPAGYWTEGYGSVITVNGKMAHAGIFPTLESILPYRTTKTKEEAKEKLIEALNSRCIYVKNKLTVPVNQSQFDALLSHYYNCGYSKHLYHLVNTNADIEEIKEWFMNHYIKAGGKVLKGLQLRRADEFEIYYYKEYKRDYVISFKKKE